jgi:hypothetical protein
MKTAIIQSIAPAQLPSIVDSEVRLLRPPAGLYLLPTFRCVLLFPRVASSFLSNRASFPLLPHLRPGFLLCCLSRLWWAHIFSSSVSDWLFTSKFIFRQACDQSRTRGPLPCCALVYHLYGRVTVFSQCLNAFTNLRKTWYIYPATWAQFNGEHHKSLRPVIPTFQSPKLLQ